MLSGTKLLRLAAKQKHPQQVARLHHHLLLAPAEHRPQVTRGLLENDVQGWGGSWAPGRIAQQMEKSTHVWSARRRPNYVILGSARFLCILVLASSTRSGRDNLVGKKPGELEFGMELRSF